jgi:hypothetical protein
MSLWKALFKKPNGVAELEDMRQEFSAGGRRVVESAKRLARAAETVARQKRESELAEQIARFRIAEGFSPEGAE